MEWQGSNIWTYVDYLPKVKIRPTNFLVNNFCLLYNTAEILA